MINKDISVNSFHYMSIEQVVIISYEHYQRLVIHYTTPTVNADIYGVKLIFVNL